MLTPNSKMVIREYPWVGWVIGTILLVLAAPDLPGLFSRLGKTDSMLDLLLVAIGLFLLLWGSTLTVTADSASYLLTLAYRSPLKASKNEIPFSQVARIELETSGTAGRQPTYRIVIVCKDGQDIPYHSYYSAGAVEKDRYRRANHVLIERQPPNQFLARRRRKPRPSRRQFRPLMQQAVAINQNAREHHEKSILTSGVLVH